MSVDSGTYEKELFPFDPQRRGTFSMPDPFVLKRTQRSPPALFVIYCRKCPSDIWSNWRCFGVVFNARVLSPATVTVTATTIPSRAPQLRYPVAFITIKMNDSRPGKIRCVSDRLSTAEWVMTEKDNFPPKNRSKSRPPKLTFFKSAASEKKLHTALAKVIATRRTKTTIYYFRIHYVLYVSLEHDYLWVLLRATTPSAIRRTVREMPALPNPRAPSGNQSTQHGHVGCNTILWTTSLQTTATFHSRDNES